jgi:hypothetical protein
LAEWKAQLDITSTNAYIPLQPQFFEQMENQKKTAEYRSYLMNEVERLWFMNMESHFIMHMAEARQGTTHSDKQPDRTLKKKCKYHITALHKLDTPLYPNDRRLQQRNPQGPIYMTKKPPVELIKLWMDKGKEKEKETWEASPIETWGNDPPEDPKPPSPPLPQKTEEQKHAAMHWSFCQEPDCQYHQGHQSFYM